MDPGSTHNMISKELAEKLGIKVEEMGPTMEAEGVFKGQQEVPVTPLIGKLRIHVQGYVDQEEFFISPLLHQDVILGAPWFHRKSATLVYPERLVNVSHRSRDIVLRTHNKGGTIALIDHKAYNKSMRSGFSSYMIFVRDLKSERNISNKSLIKVKSNFLRIMLIVFLKPYLMSYLLQEGKMIIK